MTVLSKVQNDDWSSGDSIRHTLLFAASYVANIFLFTLNDVFSKCGSSVVSGRDKAIWRKVWILIMKQLMYDTYMVKFVVECKVANSQGR